MELAQTIFYQLIALLSMSLVGWALAKAGHLADESALNALLVNAALPALVLNTLQTPYSLDLLGDMGVTLLGMCVVVAVSGGVGWAATLFLKKRGSVQGAWIACTAFPNAVYMGQPLMTALYGEAVLPLVAPILLVFNLTSFTLGGWLLSSRQAGARRNLKALLLTPVIICSGLGVLLHFMPFRLPVPLRSGLGMLASLNTPISMVVIGSQLAKCSLREILLDASSYLLCLIRLMPAAIACHLALRLFIADPVILGVLTIAACMPTAAIIPVIARDRGGEALLCSKTSFVSTLLCVVTAPLLLAWLLR